MLSALHAYFKPISLILMVLLGLTCGHLAGSLLQVKLKPDITAALPESGSVEAKQPEITEADLNQILRQNLFSADQRSASATLSVAANQSATESSATMPPPSDLKLIGTVVAGADSLALIESGDELKLYRLEEELPGGSVESIERSRVTIRTDGQRLITLLLHEPEAGAKAGEVSAAPNSTDSGQTTITSETAGMVKQVDETSWVVSTDLVESVRENFAAQLRLAQMQPRLVDGKTDGFFIRRINPRSVLAQMGLQRGDVVIEVNNIKLDSPEKALQVFQQLREARQIAVGVIRDDQPMTFSYEIQ